MGLLAVFLVTLITGCVNNAQFGAIDNKKGLKGLVVTPGQCFSDAISNSEITTGNPLPNAKVYFYGSESGCLDLFSTTSSDGVIKVDILTSSGYVIYVFREYPEGSGQFIILKKAIIDNSSQGINSLGEINTYTTAQVIIWEQVNLLFGEDFTPFDPLDQSWGFIPANLILSVSDIDSLVPNLKLLNSVEAALQECRDPQKDNTVIKYAKEIAKAQFGAPEPSPQPTQFIIYPTPCLAPLPDVRFTLTVNGLTVTFKNLSTNATHYLWDYGDGSKSATSAPSHSHTYKVAGSYLVTLTAYNVCGKSISTAQMVDNIGAENNSEGMGISY